MYLIVSVLLAQSENSLFIIGKYFPKVKQKKNC